MSTRTVILIGLSAAVIVGGIYLYKKSQEEVVINPYLPVNQGKLDDITIERD